MAPRGPARRGPVRWLAALLLGASVHSGCLGGPPIGEPIGDARQHRFYVADHFSMLNDHGRNEFYRQALAAAMPACGPDCSVVDLGAGSGLLSMLAASAGAAHVLAIEENAGTADVAERIIGNNRPSLFPDSNVTVLRSLSTSVAAGQLPGGRRADLLVTETFGVYLLGEGALAFLPDARDRLLRADGSIIPAGGCQYVTLVEAPEFARSFLPGEWGGLNLTRLQGLSDRGFWKGRMGGEPLPATPLTERLCVHELDFHTARGGAPPRTLTLRARALRSGVAHAALLDWDVWSDRSRSSIMSNAPGARNFPGDAAWGWLLQPLDAGRDGASGALVPLALEEGEALDVRVDTTADSGPQGPKLFMHVQASRAAALPPDRTEGTFHWDIEESNQHLLPTACDYGRHQFYKDALDAALSKHRGDGHRPSVLDFSLAGIPALLASKHHGADASAAVRGQRFGGADLLHGIARDSGASLRVHTLGQKELPQVAPADVVVLEPLGSPLQDFRTFELAGPVRERLLAEGGSIVPSGGCLEAGLVESEELAQLSLIPGGFLGPLDLRALNAETRRQGLLQRATPLPWWAFGRARPPPRWLSDPVCVVEVDFQREQPVEKGAVVRRFETKAGGRAHLLVARWVSWAPGAGGRRLRLGREGGSLARERTWLHMAQVLEAPGSPSPDEGVFEPPRVAAGETWRVLVNVTPRASGVPMILMALQGREEAASRREL